jgi:SOS-response transcriptional repressor LexA
MNYSGCIDKIRQYLNTTNAGLEKILDLGNGYISNILKNGTDNPGKLLIALKKVGISTDWFLSGEGEMLLDKKPESSLQIPKLGAMIDQRLEKIEAEIAQLKNSLKETGKDTPDFGIYTGESEPEYGENAGDISYVDNIAAGRPIYASEDLSTIPVPMRYIKTKPEDYYAGRIKGTSMTAAGIPDGVRVLIRISDVPRDGAIQVVECNGEVTLKRVREIPGKGWKLCFDDYSVRYIEVGPGDEFRVQGDFVAVLSEDGK